jgi:DNA-binding GntR family transcriptional regulator
MKLEHNIFRGEEIFEILRADIVSGRLTPSTRLVESEIATEFEVSRTPVREALNQLEAKGYAVRQHQGGRIVATRSPVEIRNLYEVREALETMAIKLTCQRATEAQISKAEEYYRISSEDALNRDIRSYLNSGDLFHDALLEGCGNQSLLSLIRTCRDQSTGERLLRVFTPAEWRQSVMKHGKMLEALRKRNERQAQKAVRDHLKNAMRIAMERL